jgi:putative tricarboxylic transport membrane protein
MRVLLVSLVPAIALVIASCAPAAQPGPTPAPAKPAETKPAPAAPASPAAAPAASPAVGAAASPAAGAASPAAKPAAASGPVPRTKSGYPDRPISFIVPYAAGGGSDIMVRSLDKIAADLKVLPQNLTISNVAGGSSFTGKQQAISRPPDGYTLTMGDDSTVFGQALGQAPMKYNDFTYIARMVTDYNMVIVRSESPFRTLKDWLDAAKANPKSVKVAGTGTGNVDHVMTAEVEKRSGVQFTYVPFDSGGQVLTNILGGQVDSAWANPSEAYEQMRAGKVRALGISSPERLKDPGFVDVPTLKEQGVDFVGFQFRGVAGPKGMQPETVAYLEEVFKRVADSEQWKTDYLDKFQQINGWMGSAEFTKFMDQYFQETEKAFAELPSLKQP